MSKKPNVLFILIDDMGWKDLSCYGSDFYETPNIDSIAKNGMKFLQAYSTCPVCSPARASIMTGKYPARVGITDWIDFAEKPSHPLQGMLMDAPYKKGLPSDEYTIAKAFQDNGYNTWHVGKWHLGEKGKSPLEFGFDVNIGGCDVGSPGPSGYFSPWETISALKDVDVPKDTYLTDYLGDQASDLIRNLKSDQSFFMHMSFYAVHTPIQAKQEKLDKYTKKAKDMGLDKIDPFTVGGKGTTIDKQDRDIIRRTVQSDVAYAGLIDSLDENIGKILTALKEKNLLEDTIIVFTSDNGGLATSEGCPTSNLPLSEGKGWMYEGGTREPMMIQWQGKIKPHENTKNYVTGTDFYPTLLELAGLDLVENQHVDGKSFAPLLTANISENDFERGAIYWHYPHYGNQGGSPASSVRENDMKLIYFYEDHHAELYNVVSDIEERHDIAKENPELVKKLVAMIQTWMIETKALTPEKNPNFKTWQGRTVGYHSLENNYKV